MVFLEYQKTQDGRDWVSLFTCNVVVVRCEPQTEHCVVSKDYKGHNYSGHDRHKWGMMHEMPPNGQRNQRALGLGFFSVVVWLVC